MDGMFSLAVHALVYLNHKNCIISSEALAENICTNPARVRKVMAKLKKSGFVETKEGSVGGYRFSGNAQTCTLTQVADALEIHFVGSAWRSGDSDMECLVASGMADIMDSIYSQLNQQCREYLMHISIADIDQRIFGTEKKL